MSKMLLLSLGLLSILVFDVCHGGPDTCLDGPDFVSWLQNQGATVSGKISLQEVEGYGRGLVALDTIEEGEWLFTIPKSMMFMKENFPQVARVEREDEALAVVLLQEKCKGEDSPWNEYIKLLPDPKLFRVGWKLEESELEELQDEEFADQLRRTRQGVAKSYEKYKDMLPCGDSLDMYEWAFMMVESRALNLNGHKFLVPLADMFNYETHPKTRQASNGDFFLKHHVMQEDGSMKILSDRRTEAGNQVFMDYGDNTNQIYFAHHGFVPTHNPYDCFKISLKPDDKASDKIKALVERMRLPQPAMDCFRWNNAKERWSKSPVQYMDIVLNHLSSGQVDLCLQKLSSVKSRDEFFGVARDCVATKMSTDRLTKLTEKMLQESKPAGSSTSIASAYRDAQSRVMKETLDYLRNGEIPSSVGLSLENALVKIQAQVAKARSSKPERKTVQEKVDTFNKWVKERKFPVQNVEAAYLGDDSMLRVGTIVIADSIKAEEPYLVIPEDVVMDTTTMERSLVYPFIQHLSDNLGKKDDFHELLIFFMFEYFVMGQESFWWPYLDLLPRRGEFFPPTLYESEQDFELLEGHPTKEHVQSVRSEIYGKFGRVQTFLYNELGDQFFPRDLFTEENYVYAHAILDSRGIWWDNRRHLVPLLDLVNCKANAKYRVHSTFVDKKLGGVTTKSAQPYSKGEQLFEDYGQPNHIYFAYHGFSLPDNLERDCFRVGIPLDTNDRKTRYGMAKYGDPKHRNPTDEGKGYAPFCLKYPLQNADNRIYLETLDNNFDFIRYMLTKLQKDVFNGHDVEYYITLMESTPPDDVPKRNIIQYMIFEYELLNEIIQSVPEPVP